MNVPNSAARWRVFFYPRHKQQPGLVDPVVSRFVEWLPALLEAHGRVAGQPFLFGPDGLPDGE